VGPDLEKLLYHHNERVRDKAREFRRAIHLSRAPRLRIQTLGGFRVWRGDYLLVEKDWEGNQPKLLLKTLIAFGPRELPIDVIMEELWPETTPEVAEKIFKVTLHRLRKSLEPTLNKTFGSTYVHLKANLVSLSQEFFQIDSQEFIRLYKTAAVKDAGGNIKEALTFYGQALELYKGDFLPEELYLPWAEAKREELRTSYVEILRRLAQVQEMRGSLSKAIDWYKKLLKADPLSEESYQKLMLLYAQKDSRSAAIKVYQDCCKILKEVLSADPDTVTKAIYHKILASS